MRLLVRASSGPPSPVLLGNPLHPVVILDHPAVCWDVVGYLDELEPAKIATRSIQADIVDDPDEYRIVACHVIIDVPVFSTGYILGGLLVQSLGFVGEIESSIAAVQQDPPWHVLE
jgi:hypothetical protein